MVTQLLSDQGAVVFKICQWVRPVAAHSAAVVIAALQTCFPLTLAGQLFQSPIQWELFQSTTQWALHALTAHRRCFDCVAPGLLYSWLVIAHLAADAASSKKRSRQLRSPFDESQTEYVKIPSTVKRRSVEALTEHQQEVAARQKAGEQGNPNLSFSNPQDGSLVILHIASVYGCTTNKLISGASFCRSCIPSQR